MKKPKQNFNNYIEVSGANEHNLQNVSTKFPSNSLILFTGVSGSGKSSMAFDTIFKEGQRRYLSVLGAHSREEQIAKPQVESVQGLSATIAIEQKSINKQARSTVGTLTEIYDYLRVLWAYAAIPYCPESADPLSPQSVRQIVQSICQNLQEGDPCYILAPIEKGKKGNLEDLRQKWLKAGYQRALIDQRLQLLESEDWQLDPSKPHDFDLVVDRIKIFGDVKARLREAVENALELGNGICKALLGKHQSQALFSTFSYSEKSQKSYLPLTPSDFSFNSPQGMCPRCHGLGNAMDWKMDRVICEDKSIRQGALAILGLPLNQRITSILYSLGQEYLFDLDTTWKQISKEAQEIILRGFDPPWVSLKLTNPRTGRRWHERILWKGILGEAWQRYQEYKSTSAKKKLEPFLSEGLCPECKGSRIRPYPAAAKLFGSTIGEFCAMSAQEALCWLRQQNLSQEILDSVGPVISQVQQKLQWMIGLGLDYLTLDRLAPTLSGGEAQRVRLSAHIGSGLTGVTYVLDEPSIGLHARDNQRLIQALKVLRDKGNTVIVVEHDDETIFHADWVLDFGPGAGKRGGELVYNGKVQGLLDCPQSLTGKFLKSKTRLSREKIGIPIEKWLHLKGCHRHNLNELDLSFPLQRLVGLTGVSGSGKSTLMHDCLFSSLQALENKQKPHFIREILSEEKIDKIIYIDQSPIGRLPRSNPATYIKLFDDIRSLFAMLPEAKARGYQAGRFSFNVQEGSCEQCMGMGYVKVDMDFMADEFVLCSQCQGRQFDESTLDIEYRGKNIYDLLQATVDEALEIFQDHPKIKHKLQTLSSVGLGYLPLGHPSPYLSGGEAQRVKLAKQLIRPCQKHTLYLLDEPTTGLHLYDIQKLLDVLSQLVKLGHTVLIIEHHLDFLSQCDWLIELGPQGGKEGGHLVAQGNTTDFLKEETPTADALKTHLSFIESPSAHALKIQKAALNSKSTQIEVSRAHQNNLKELDLSFEHGLIHHITGPSGSGKSSLLQQTLYAYGLRQYADTLSAYARQFIKLPPEPQVDHIYGLGPCVMVHGEHHSQNPRSTVGTVTEIYDFLRVLYAQLGQAYCPKTLRPIVRVGSQWLYDQVLKFPEHSRIQIMTPLSPMGAEECSKELQRCLKKGFVRLHYQEQNYEIGEFLEQIEQYRGKTIELSIVVDRIIVGKTDKERLISSIEQACELGSGEIIFQSPRDQKRYHSGFCEPISGQSYHPLSPQDFAFNHQKGWCQKCMGLGKLQTKVDTSPLRQSTRTIQELLKGLARPKKALAFCQREQIPLTQAVCTLHPRQREKLLWGQPKKLIIHKQEVTAQEAFKGIALDLPLPEGSEMRLCPECGGGRLNALSAHVILHNKTLSDLCQTSIYDLTLWIEGLSSSLSDQINSSVWKIAHEPLRQVQERIKYLEKVGLSYLSLHAGAPELSLGERSRVRLAKQLGAQLSRLCYILDEVSCGLHPKDSQKLALTLHDFKKQGNTVIVADHNRQWLRNSDRVIELGPTGGEGGGYLCFDGTTRDYLKSPTPLAQAMWEPSLQKKDKPKPIKAWVKIKNACAHTLKSIDTQFPVGAFTSICGLSGSGKTSLLEDCLWDSACSYKKNGRSQVFRYCEIDGLENFDHFLYVDSSPMGKSSRADVGSYLDLLSECRKIWAQLPEAKSAGLSSRYFSPNTKYGMCKKCRGLGYRVVDLKFMPPTLVSCEHCHGWRLQDRSLQIHYRNKHFGQLLKMSLAQAANFLQAWPKVQKICQAAIELGLGHLRLGEEIARLSIGESQRLKLANVLKKKHRSKILFLLDEPSKGLHPRDMQLLIRAIERLKDMGHTIVCVEHSPEILAASDYIIELGPQAGPDGGQVLFEGSVKNLCSEKKSNTAPYLRNFIKI